MPSSCLRLSTGSEFFERVSVDVSAPALVDLSLQKLKNQPLGLHPRYPQIFQRTYGDRSGVLHGPRLTNFA